MYSLYHIKGIKWGCSKRLHQRLKNQGYTINDVCEVIEVSDIDTASDMEKELNIRDGYLWNKSQDYRRIKKMASKGGTAVHQKYPDISKRLGSKSGRENGLKSRHKVQKPVLQFDLQGNLIKEWPGVNFAKRETGIHITHCVRGLKKTAGGYIWKFKS